MSYKIFNLDDEFVCAVKSEVEAMNVIKQTSLYFIESNYDKSIILHGLDLLTEDYNLEDALKFEKMFEDVYPDMVYWLEMDVCKQKYIEMWNSREEWV